MNINARKRWRRAGDATILYGKTGWQHRERSYLFILYEIVGARERYTPKRGPWWVLLDTNTENILISCESLHQFVIEYVSLRIDGLNSLQ